jgi:hypothetical protein
VRSGVFEKILNELPFRSAAVSREESVVSLPAESRFLAGTTGFGMTTGTLCAIAPSPNLPLSLTWPCRPPTILELHDRPNHFALPDCRKARRRWNGRLSGDAAKARIAYQDFFTVRKDADPDISILKEARAEYAKLN